MLEGETVTYERAIKAAGGAQRVLEVNLLPQRDEDGGVQSAFVLITDITRHRLSELEVRESEERLRKFADATHEGIVFHEDGVITDCNDAGLRLIGYRYDELVGRRVLDFVAPDSRDAVLNNIRLGYERAYEGAILHKDGTRIAVELTGKTMPYKGKHYRMTVIRDIRDRKAAEARIQFLAHHDTLTGLPNRVLLMDRLEFILASARRRQREGGHPLHRPGQLQDRERLARARGRRRAAAPHRHAHRGVAALRGRGLAPGRRRVPRGPAGPGERAVPGPGGREAPRGGERARRRSRGRASR